MNYLLKNIDAKRIFDVVFASVLLILLSPLLISIYFIIYFETGKNPLFTQFRGIILEKNVFKIYKFRTLKRNGLSNPNNSRGIFLKENSYNTVTMSGFILRKTGLDELPQLVNILHGEMSFIGPRPLSLEDLVVLKRTEPAYYKRRSQVSSKPGISGYWQIFGNRFGGTKNLIECEEHYEKTKSFLVDLFLVLMTIPIILLGKHSDSIINSRVNNSSVPQYLLGFKKQKA